MYEKDKNKARALYRVAEAQALHQVAKTPVSDQLFEDPDDLRTS